MNESRFSPNSNDRVFPLRQQSHGEREEKTHTYSQAKRGTEFVLEPLDQKLRYCMTGIGKDIEIGDYIVLQNMSEMTTFRVEEINYYSEPPNMWIAALKKVS
jgi:MioC protein